MRKRTEQAGVKDFSPYDFRRTFVGEMLERGVDIATVANIAGLVSVRARGRLGGRPRGLSSEDIAAAKALLSDPSITMEEVAKRLGVAPSTLYRHLPGGRSGMEN